MEDIESVDSILFNLCQCKGSELRFLQMKQLRLEKAVDEVKTIPHYELYHKMVSMYEAVKDMCVNIDLCNKNLDFIEEKMKENFMACTKECLKGLEREGYVILRRDIFKDRQFLESMKEIVREVMEEKDETFESCSDTTSEESTLHFSKVKKDWKSEPALTEGYDCVPDKRADYYKLCHGIVPQLTREWESKCSLDSSQC